jgi:FMN phosphatase YigB (HAD superfamily)
MSSVEAVCFDLDGTLCLPERSDHEFHSEVFDRAGVDPIFTPSDLRAVDSAAIEREAGPVGPAATPDGDGLSAFFTKLYRATLRSIETDVDPESPLVDELGVIAGDLYDPTAVRLREGAPETLEYVSEHYEVGLVTNGTRETQRWKLETLGIAETFDTTVFCDPDRGIESKPDPEPFELAVASLSVGPEELLHVGDSHREDVVGAEVAGLESAWVPVDRPHENLPADPHPAPSYRLSSLPALRSII